VLERSQSTSQFTVGSFRAVEFLTVSSTLLSRWHRVQEYSESLFLNKDPKANGLTSLGMIKHPGLKRLRDACLAGSIFPSDPGIDRKML
jgi:hypothetical protein